MKKTIIAVAMLLAAAPIFAQTTDQKAKAIPVIQHAAGKTSQATKQMPSPEARAVSYTNELKQKLSLTDDQYKKILTVNAECIRRKDALKASGEKSVQGSKDISAYRQQQYQAILNPDQQGKLKAINAQGGGKSKGGQ